MRKLMHTVVAGVILSATSVTLQAAETVVVPVGPATIKVVEIGVPPVKQDARTAISTSK